MPTSELGDEEAPGKEIRSTSSKVRENKHRTVTPKSGKEGI